MLAFFIFGVGNSHAEFCTLVESERLLQIGTTRHMRGSAADGVANVLLLFPHKITGARAWAAVIEPEMTRGVHTDRTESGNNTLGDLLRRHLAEMPSGRRRTVALDAGASPRDAPALSCRRNDTSSVYQIKKDFIGGMDGADQGF
ncbi:hypothetical protein [Ralstonia pseudosolanacearum]